MAATCIVCGQPAGSHEHLFPAVLGGRRTTKKVYCHDHNQLYGYLIGVLNAQLKPFNVQLGVVSDNRRGDGPQSLVMDLPAGAGQVALSMAGTKLQGAAIVHSEPLPDGRERKTLRVRTQAEADKVVEALRKKGIDLELEGPGEPGVMLTPDKHRVSIKLGGEPAHACIAYIAQTYLAMLMPTIARDPAFAPFVRFTLANAQLAKLESVIERQSIAATAVPDGQEVTATQMTEAQAQAECDAARAALPAGIKLKWTAQDPTADVPNAYPFGHRVLVGVDAADGQVYAHVSLFSTLHYTIGFGISDAATETKEVCTDIDPLALNAPHDVRTLQLSGVAHRGAFDSPAPMPTQADIQCLAGQLQQRMYRHSVRQMADRAIAALDAAAIAAAAGPQHTRELIHGKVRAEFRQLTWNEVKRCVDARETGLKVAGRTDEARVLQSTFAFEPTQGTGTTAAGGAALDIALGTLTSQMVSDHGAGLLTVDRLTALLLGDAGATVIADAIQHSVDALVGA